MIFSAQPWKYSPVYFIEICPGHRPVVKTIVRLVRELHVFHPLRVPFPVVVVEFSSNEIHTECLVENSPKYSIFFNV